MTSFWDKLQRGIKEGIHNVSEKTEELTKIGRIKLSIIAVKRDIEKNFIELGGRVYHLLNESRKVRIASDDKIKSLVERTKNLEEKLNGLEKDLENIQSGEIKHSNAGGGS
jgi:hypothetical protein